MKLVLPFVMLLALPGAVPAHAQQLAAPITDTTGYVRGGYGKTTSTYYDGNMVQADGRPMRAYLPATQLGFAKTLDFFYAAPAKNSRVVRQTMPVSEVRSMAVHGRYYETMQLGLKKPDILALRVVDGPVELFTYAAPGVVPIPMPMVGMGGALMPGMLLTSGIYANNHWYVRREGVLTEVSRAHFAEQLSEYLREYPELAQAVADGHAGYRYRDIAVIITEFNQYKRLPAAKQ